MKQVKLNNFTIGDQAGFVLIAGPCVLENEAAALEIASYLKQLTSKLHIPFIFKASYDKANRTSIKAYRGPGLQDGLKILKNIKEKIGVPILSDVHRFEEIDAAAAVLDIMQVPAFLCRQTDFVVQIAKKAKIVNVKKGQFLAPWDVANIIEKIKAAGNEEIMITERGASFGYNNLVFDVRALPIMRAMGYPVIFDATHSVQLPGGAGTASSGQRDMVPYLARAAVAAGVDGIFMEVHPDPEKALCDGANSLYLNTLEALLTSLKKIDETVKGKLRRKVKDKLMLKKEIQEKLKKIKMLILDVDGVMTDGSIIMDSDGREMKNFNVRDGHGLVMLQRHGIQVAILTGRTSAVVEHRARDLKITEVYQGALNKKEVFAQILEKNNLTPEVIAYLGDDIVDIPVLKMVGFSAAVADALDLVKKTVDYVTVNGGGQGAVREICEMLLMSQGYWTEVAARYDFTDLM